MSNGLAYGRIERKCETHGLRGRRRWWRRWWRRWRRWRCREGRLRTHTDCPRDTQLRVTWLIVGGVVLDAVRDPPWARSRRTSQSDTGSCSRPTPTRRAAIIRHYCKRYGAVPWPDLGGSRTYIVGTRWRRGWRRRRRWRIAGVPDSISVTVRLVGIPRTRAIVVVVGNAVAVRIGRRRWRWRTSQHW